uniref:J domain-containing protein n=1 Tax=Panagrolaimus davidi TaxID=227884 RepID=A0A914PSS7_9BILA
MDMQFRCAFIFGGPWGAAGGAVVGGVGEAVRQQLYHTDNCISQDLKDAYAFLGISSSANNEEVEKAYREKSLIYHPDKAGVADAQSQLNMSAELIRNSRSDTANLEEFEVVSK